MSIVRMGEDGSGVYLYNSGDGYRCHWCDIGTPDLFSRADDLITHLQAHVVAGHHVPGWVFETVRFQGDWYG